MTQDTLKRFFESLVEALRERGPQDLTAPFTVAEIYQDLVPYRTHRDVLGFEMNGDYEHALLQLLAGREGYLELESEHALEEIRTELDGKNPDTSLYRDFAAVDVRISPGMVPPAPTSAPPPAEVAGEENAPEPSAAEALAVRGVESLAPDPGAAPDTSASPTTFIEGASPGTSRPVVTPSADGICRSCHSRLPDRDDLRYCPFCGEDLSRTPCGSCGELLEPDWDYCIVCGAPKGQ